MVLIADLLAAPAGRALKHLAGPDDHREVTSVALIEGPRDLGPTDKGALVFVWARSTNMSTDYQIDVLLRQAASSDVAALAVSTPSVVPGTACSIANKYGIALLHYPGQASLARLIIDLDQEIAGDASRTLQRLATAAMDVQLAASEGALPEELVTTIARTTDVDIRVDETSGPAPAVVAGSGLAERGHGGEIALALARLAVASEVGGGLRATVRSRAAVITELLHSARAPEESLIERARALGIVLDGSHVVIALELDFSGTPTESDLSRQFEFSDQIARRGLDALQRRGRSWSMSSSGGVLLFVSSAIRTEPLCIDEAATEMLSDVRERYPDLRFYCGSGLSHIGVHGLRRSAAEARAAAAMARSRRITTRVVQSDTGGLRRMLMELAASDASRALVDDMLAPLDALSESKARSWIETLEIYLAANRSLIEAARHLHLHRNAVVYRIKKIVELLDVDLEDADTRFLLELACRVRRTGSPG